MEFNILIISDTICPWCFIGYRRLRLAISQHLATHPNDTFSISWHPFQLNPNAPKGQTSDKRAVYERNYGAEQTELIFERLRTAAKGTGINFSFEGRTGSTLDSHRLLEYAEEKDAAGAGGRKGSLSGLQTRLAEELFGDYFERERDITSHDILVNAAERAGLDGAEARKFLESEALAKEVAEKARVPRENGINGVPHFSINDTFTVEGAQEPAAFLMLFRRLRKRQMKM